MAAVTAGVVAGAAGVGLGLANMSAQQKAAARARGDAAAIREQGLELYEDLISKIPSVNERILNLNRLKQVGELTPEMEEAIKQEETELNKILLDPRFRQEQTKAMDRMNEILENEGLDPVAKAQLQKLQSEVNNINKARQGAILQQAAAQGRLTSGSTLTAQLLAAQDAASREAEMGSQIAGEQFKRYTDAIGSQANLATGLREQEYGEQADLRKAQDAINAFNTNQMASTQQRNVDRSNIAQQANLNTQQRIADENVGLSNLEEESRVNAIENQYQDQYNAAAGKSNVLSGQATQAQNRADAASNQARQSGAGVMSGIGKIGGAIASSDLFTNTINKTPPSGEFIGSPNPDKFKLKY